MYPSSSIVYAPHKPGAMLPMLPVDPISWTLPLEPLKPHVTLIWLPILLMLPVFPMLPNFSTL